MENFYILVNIKNGFVKFQIFYKNPIKRRIFKKK